MNVLKFPVMMVKISHLDNNDSYLKMCQFFTKQYQVEKIKFIETNYHRLEETLGNDYHLLIAETIDYEEEARKKIAQEIQPYLLEPINIDIDIELQSGKMLELLSMAMTEIQPDLFVMNMQAEPDAAVIIRRLAKIFPCSILLIPPKVPHSIKSIFIPVDFSKNSMRALIHGMHLKNNDPAIKINCLHAITPPRTAYRINKNFQENLNKLKKRSEEQFAQFLSNYKLNPVNFSFHSILNEEMDVSYYIQKFKKVFQSDLIILGAQGHSMLDSFVFGSVTEKLVHKEKETILLIIR